MEPLIAALRDADHDVRWRAAWALGQTWDAQAEGPCIRALDDDDANVRWSAAEGLGILKDENAVAPLINLLNNPGEEIMLRLVAANALGKIGSFKAEAALQQVILRDDFVPIHETARTALERIKKRE